MLGNSFVCSLCDTQVSKVWFVGSEGLDKESNRQRKDIITMVLNLYRNFNYDKITFEALTGSPEMVLASCFPLKWIYPLMRHCV